jgi:hypothetical protein
MRGSQLPSVGHCGDTNGGLVQAKLERGFSPGHSSSPDRVPVPEDEFRELNMTDWEKMEFFTYKFRFDHLTDEQEQSIKLAWLREKRRLTREQLLAAQLNGSEDPPSTDPNQPPFGFGNTLDALDEDDEDKDNQAA